MKTFNVTGNESHSTVGNDSTNGAQPETFNVFGVTELNLSLGWGDTVTVNLEPHSEWIGGFDENPGGDVVVRGSVYDKGTFYNTVSDVNGSASIGANVIGRGTFNLFESHSAGKLEFLYGVSSNETVNDSGYAAYGGEFGVVQADSPLAYHAHTNLGFGELLLEGLKATSYSLRGDLLSLFDGRRLVDTQTISTTPAADPLKVWQMGSVVAIRTDDHTGGVLLAHS